MRRVALFVMLAGSVLTLVLAGCSSEPAKTQQLYLDARNLMTVIDSAFTLPGRSPQRVELMNKIISDKWDLQVVEKLREYLKEAPNGKYAKDATALLDQAMKSDRLRMLGQVRPVLEQQGIPKTPAEADSVAQRMQREQKAQQPQDTTAKPAEPGGK